MFVDYVGDLHCIATHGPSGSKIETDAPVDIQGKGEKFSPTDLLGVSLAACIGTTIAVYAKRYGWDLKGMKLDVEKIMTKTLPRKISELPVQIYMPKDLNIGMEDRKKIERVALTCPVHESLHPDVKSVITFYWPD